MKVYTFMSYSQFLANKILQNQHSLIKDQGPSNTVNILSTKFYFVTFVYLAIISTKLIRYTQTRTTHN